MVWYSAKWIWPITILVLMSVLVAFVVSFMKGQINLRDLGKGLLVFVIPFLAAPLLALIPVILGLNSFGTYALYNQNWFFAGFCFLILSVFVLPYAITGQNVGAGSLAMSVILLFTPVLIFASAKMPMGSFIIAWPMLFSALGLIVYFLLNDSGTPWKKLIIGSVSAFPALVLIAPLLITLNETFTFLMGSIMLILAGLMFGPVVLLFTPLGQTPSLNYGLPAAAELLAVVSFL